MKNLKRLSLTILIIAIAIIVVNRGYSYTIADYNYLKELILEEREPTRQELRKYDFNNDRMLSSSDYVTLANLIKRGEE